MPVQHIYGTAGATGGGFATLMTLQPYFEEPTGEPRWCYQRRSPKTYKDPYNFFSGWSFGVRIGCAGELDYCMGNDITKGGGFEPFSCDGEGTSVSRFIRGTVVDATDVPIANAIVQGFRTDTDAYVGQDVSRLDGSYTLATDTPPGVQHYLVAYKPGSPDIAGTTVNTITSTLVDGT